MKDRQQIDGQGLQLCARFYHEAVRPILDAHLPDLQYAAALIGSGSEVLGFDDEMSTDHHWGPRVMLFVSPDDCPVVAEPIRTLLADNLPYSFQGYSTHFGEPDPDDRGVQHLETIDTGPVNHRVTVHTVADFSQEYLGFNVEEEPTAADWLSFPQQKLRTLAGGAVFHDGIGLETMRARYRYYPHDIWLYQLASAWERIGEEEHLMGRAGYVGDDLGSRLIAARLVRDAMNLAFLLERVYAPYAKWFGTAFRRLASAPTLTPHLDAVLAADEWQERDKHLGRVYETLATLHNDLGLAEALSVDARSFFGRPFTVIFGERFADALLKQLTDPAVISLARSRHIGGIDLFSDSTALREEPQRRPRIRDLYL